MSIKPMNRFIYLTSIVLLLSFRASPQSAKEISLALETIESLEQVDSLKLAHPSWNIRINKIILNGFMYDSLLFYSEVGTVVQTQKSVKT